MGLGCLPRFCTKNGSSSHSELDRSSFAQGELNDEKMWRSR
jgi:hypothetical protein